MKKESLLEKIRSASTPAETPQKGFMTSQQWAVKWGVSLAHAQRVIRAGLQQKLVVKKDYRIDVSGTRRKIAHYAEP